AERRLVETEKSKGYLPIDGTPVYGQCVQRLLLGADSDLVAAGRVATSHTPGGTGALRVAANFIQSEFPSARVWLSQPTWPNHPKIFEAANIETVAYPYFDAATNGLDFTAMKAALEQIPAGDVVLLHGCCHNPTGIDPTPEQWEQIAAIVHERGLLPLVDFAYQGFATGLGEDAVALCALLGQCDELLICSSFSKNFGLYNERVGALTAIAATREAAAAAQSQIKAGIRANYSNPPAHGAAVVSTILQDADLSTQWETELAGMRERINTMRSLFVETLQAKGVPGDYSFITRQSGMFSFSGLTPEHVAQLKQEFAIYIVGSGRINVAGMTETNMDRLCSAIKSVVS
ncbi:MAG: aspartate/tyrosine/aromatic aminotransferase, partial [Planctomycetales bacterium]|nr:aspartate/tyrosine/aromatic aminotransferase [Planctomycetales bacterium]